MSKRIFITATNTDIGKTYTTKLLLKKFTSMGYKVGVIKPIETGVVDGYCPDGNELLNCVKEFNNSFHSFTVNDIVPIQYTIAAAPFIASNNTKLDYEKIDKAIEKIEKNCDILLIEGAGGLYVPIDSNTMMIDLIKYFKASALLVTHCSLGCINDTILSKKALDLENIKNITTFNCRKDDNFKEISESYFEKIDFDILKVDKDMDKICDVLYNL